MIPNLPRKHTVGFALIEMLELINKHDVYLAS